jgi:hypothetical protein
LSAAAAADIGADIEADIVADIAPDIVADIAPSIEADIEADYIIYYENYLKTKGGKPINSLYLFTILYPYCCIFR